MALGVLDLSVVTDKLTELLTTALGGSLIWGSPPAGPPFAVNITGEPPDTLKDGNGCQLSAYLFHVTADRFQRNSPVTYRTSPNPRVPVIPFQPLSLDLFYLLTAYSAGFYAQEQQVMSMALKCFHENPIIRLPADEGEFCLTMEVENLEELSRFWQAIASPFRLGTIYRVSVVFIQAPDAPPLNTEVKTIDLALGQIPAAADGPQLYGTYAHVAYVAPADPPPTTEAASFDLFPATVSGGQPFLIGGTGLGGITHAYLTLDDGPEIDVSTWIVAAETAAAKMGMTPVGAMPDPGVYTLTVGNGAARSNGVVLEIAAQVTPPANPILTPPGGPYTLAGVGFVPTHTNLLLGAVPLTRVNVAPLAGQFRVTATTITFLPPANLPAGRHDVRVRVNNVESAPAAWITV